MKKIKIGKTWNAWCWEDENGVKHKECTKCNTLLELCAENFYKQKTTISGFRASCKKCCDKKAMKYRNNNKEKIIEAQKQWYQNNRERLNKYQRDRRASLSPEELEAVREKGRQAVMNWKRKCTSGIYTITNKINGKVYVGESYAIENRWISHRYQMKKGGIKANKEMFEDWNKHGEQAFEFKIIKELTNSTKEDRLIEEENTINKFHSKGVITYNTERMRRRIM